MQPVMTAAAAGQALRPKPLQRTLVDMTDSIANCCSLSAFDDYIHTNAIEWAARMLDHAKGQNEMLRSQNKSAKKGKKKSKQDDEQVLALLKTPGRAKKATTSSSTARDPVESKAPVVRMTRSRANNDSSTVIKPANPFARSASRKATAGPAKSKAATQKEAVKGPVTRKRKSDEIARDEKEREDHPRKKTNKAELPVFSPEQTSKVDLESSNLAPKLEGVAASSQAAVGLTAAREASAPSSDLPMDEQAPISEEAPPPKRGLSISKKSLAGANTSSTPTSTKRASSHHAVDTVADISGDDITKINTGKNAVRQSAAALSSVEALRNRLESVGATKRQSVLNASVATPGASAAAAEMVTKQNRIEGAATSAQAQASATQHELSSDVKELQAQTARQAPSQTDLTPALPNPFLQTTLPNPFLPIPNPFLQTTHAAQKQGEQQGFVATGDAKQASDKQKTVATSRLPVTSPSKNGTGVRSPAKASTASGASTWTFGAKIKGFFGLQGPAPPATGASSGVPGPSSSAAQKPQTGQPSKLLERPTAEAAVKKPVAALPSLRQPLPSMQNKIPPRKPQDQMEVRKAMPKPTPASAQSSTVDGKKRVREPETTQPKAADQKVPHKKLKVVGPTVTASGSKPSTIAARPALRPPGGIARPAHNAASATAASTARSVSAAKNPTAVVRPSASSTSSSAVRPGASGTSSSTVSRPPIALPGKGPALPVKNPGSQNPSGEKVLRSPAVISGVRPPPIARKPTAENLRAVNAIMNASVRPAAAVIPPKPAVSASSSIKPVQKTVNHQQSQAFNRMQMPQSEQRKISFPSPKPQRDEDIVLPDVHSEYSVSDDEETIRRRAAAPDWAKGQQLHDALRAQATMDPDEIFGIPTGPVPIEEMFPTSQGIRRRPRSSSGNWSGKDGLKQAEIDRYNLRMGIGTSQTF